MITITHNDSGMRIRADGCDIDGIQIQGAWICDLTVTAAAADYYHVRDEHDYFGIRELIDALRGRMQANATERRLYYPELTGCIVRTIRAVQ
jgi:hypothetical protein